MISASIKYLLRFSMLSVALKLKIPMGDSTQEQDDAMNAALASLFNATHTALFSGHRFLLGSITCDIRVFAFRSVTHFLFCLC